MNESYFTPENQRKSTYSAHEFQKRLEATFPQPLSFDAKEDMSPAIATEPGVPFLCVAGQVARNLFALPPLDTLGPSVDLQEYSSQLHERFLDSIHRNRDSFRLVVEQQKANRVFSHSGTELREVTPRRGALLLGAYIETLREAWLQKQPFETVEKLALLAKPTVPMGTDWKESRLGDVRREPWQFTANALTAVVGDEKHCEDFLTALSPEINELYNPTWSNKVPYHGGEAHVVTFSNVPQSIVDCIKNGSTVEELNAVAKREYKIAKGYDFGNEIVTFGGGDNKVTIDPLRPGQFMPTFRLSDAETGEPVATITTHRDDLMGSVGVYGVLVKDYSENAGLAKALADSGLFEERERLQGGVVLMEVIAPKLREEVRQARKQVAAAQDQRAASDYLPPREQGDTEVASL